MDIQRIEQKVLEVYQTCQIRSFPIDCASIMKAYGFTLYTYQELRQTNPELYAAARKYSDDAFKFRMSIFYNADSVDGRVRFSLMHELGHHLFGHEGRSAEEEEEADCFASHILAPRILIHHLLKEKDADSIHEYFSLSYAASNSALLDYRKWLGTKLGSAERELYALFTPAPSVPAEEKPIPEDLPEPIKKKIAQIRRRRKRTAKELQAHEKRRQFLSGVYGGDDLRIACDMRSHYEEHSL